MGVLLQRRIERQRREQHGAERDLCMLNRLLLHLSTHDLLASRSPDDVLGWVGLYASIVGVLEGGVRPSQE